MEAPFNFSTPALRHLWRTHFAMCAAVSRAWEASDFEAPAPHYPPLPDVLRDLRCGAKTRGGWPCKRRDLNRGARCRLHGGMSTGPRTPEGKRRAAMNGWWRQQRTELHGRPGIARVARATGHEKARSATRRSTTAHRAIKPHGHLIKPDISQPRRTP